MGTAPAITPPLTEWEQRLQTERADLERARRQLFYPALLSENEVSSNAEAEKKDLLP